jgi:uncharacterized LabA/DUF88 family protein
MATEPKKTRAIAFVDGQNLYHAAREAFGYTYPNYDPAKLAEDVCRQQGWILGETRFYTGMPDAKRDPFWHGFWSKKLAVMGTRRIAIFTRQLRYREARVRWFNRWVKAGVVPEEKGIDVRIALDIVRLALKHEYDVALVFSQDQDYSEVVDEIRQIAISQKRPMRVASAFPLGPGTQNRRGINGAMWIQINKQMYDNCIDPIDYRVAKSPSQDR